MVDRGILCRFSSVICTMFPVHVLTLHQDFDSTSSFLAVIVRSINGLLVSRRIASAPAPFPKDGCLHRGGGFPIEHQSFFSVGKMFRVSMFLASSFNEDMAFTFWERAFSKGMHTDRM